MYIRCAYHLISPEHFSAVARSALDSGRRGRPGSASYSLPATAAMLVSPFLTLCRAITVVALAVPTTTTAEGRAAVAVWAPQSVRVGADLAVLRGGAALRIAHHLAGHTVVVAATGRVRERSNDCIANMIPIYSPAFRTGRLQSGVRLLPRLFLLGLLEDGGGQLVSAALHRAICGRGASWLSSAHSRGGDPLSGCDCLHRVTAGLLHIHLSADSHLAL